MIKLCIFDLDGTIIDSAPDIMDSINFALEKYGLQTLSLQKMKDTVGYGLAHLLKAVIPEDRYEELEEKIRADFISYYAGHCAVKTAIYAGMKETLLALDAAGIKLAVNTNKPHIFLDNIVSSRLFSGINLARVIGAGEFPAKPDPAGVNAILTQFEVKKSECVYIGDSDVDMQTALNAGVAAIGVSWGYRGRDVLIQAGAAHLIDEACRLIPLIQAF